MALPKAASGIMEDDGDDYEQVNWKPFNAFIDGAWIDNGFAMFDKFAHKMEEHIAIGKDTRGNIHYQLISSVMLRLKFIGLLFMQTRIPSCWGICIRL